MALKITIPSTPGPSFLSSGGAGTILSLNLPEVFALSTARAPTGFFTEIASGNTPANALPAPPPDFLLPPTVPPDVDDPDFPPPDDPPEDPLQFCVELLGGTFCPTTVSYCENGQVQNIVVLAAGA